MKINRLLLAVLFIGSLLGGCKGKDGDPGPAGTAGPAGPAGPTGPAGQNLTGNLFGFVAPFDEYGNAIPKNGVSVTLEGVTPAATVTTDANGRYEFTSLRNGTYNLAFNRSGLALVRRLGVAHVGGDQPTFLGTSSISAPSTTTVGPVSVTNVSSAGVSLSIPFSNPGMPAGNFARFAIYASANSGTTAANGTLLTTFSSSTSPLNVTFSKATFNSAGFASGTTVYVVVYGAPAVLTGYNDPLTGRVVYNGLTAVSSNQVAITVP